MSEPLITPFPSLPGLTPLGTEDAGMCVDGVCAVPEGAAPEDAVADHATVADDAVPDDVPGLAAQTRSP